MYDITINDEEKDLTPHDEVQLVHSSEEVEYWASLGKAKPYPSKDCLQGPDLLILESGQTIELLFKFQTFRDVDDKVQRSSSDVIKTRKVEVTFLSRTTRQSMTLKFAIIPVNPIIDYTLRHYEPEHSHFEVTIPHFMDLSDPALNIRVSKPNAQAELDRDNSRIKVQSRTYDSLSTTNVIVFLFKDRYQSRLLATVRVEVQALSCLYRQLKAGTQNTIALSFPAENAQQVKVYSSDPRSVYLPRKNSENLQNVLPNAINYVEVCAKTYDPGEKKVVVHVINASSGGLVGSWLIKLASMLPTPTDRQHLLARVNSTTTGKYLYTNPSRRELVFEIGCSHPEIYKPTEQKMTFKGRHSQTIELEIYP